MNALKTDMKSLCLKRLGWVSNPLLRVARKGKGNCCNGEESRNQLHDSGEQVTLGTKTL